MPSQHESEMPYNGQRLVVIDALKTSSINKSKKRPELAHIIKQGDGALLYRNGFLEENISPSARRETGASKSTVDPPYLSTLLDCLCAWVWQKRGEGEGERKREGERAMNQQHLFSHSYFCVMIQVLSFSLSLSLSHSLSLSLFSLAVIWASVANLPWALV